MSGVHSEKPSIFSWLNNLITGTKAEGIEALRMQLADAAKQGILNAQALSMIEGILLVNERRVRDVMVSLPNMHSVQIGASFTEVVELIEQTQHSRYPVMNGENVIGVLFSKDLLTRLDNTDSFDICALMRDIRSVPDSKKLDILLKEFRDSRQHMVAVVDEHGEMVGLITIEDVLEQIVGEIYDEHDPLEDLWIVDHGEQYSVKGLMPLEQLRSLLEKPFESDADTVAGLLLERIEHLPEPGESITVDGYRFRVLQLEERRIHLVSVKHKPIMAGA